mmetsp:Transcript_25052/g.73826  ORF Transcript_25052/g.73826 Transcript_25052/m.73826 type:complete len:223 (+) Transcript_25052:900-1568(+)
MITHSQPRSPAFMHQALHPYAVELLTLATSALQPHRNNALFQAAAAEADRRRLDSAASTSSAAPAAAPARETEERGRRQRGRACVRRRGARRRRRRIDSLGRPRAGQGRRSDRRHAAGKVRRGAGGADDLVPSFMDVDGAGDALRRPCGQAAPELGGERRLQPDRRLGGGGSAAQGAPHDDDCAVFGPLLALQGALRVSDTRATRCRGGGPGCADGRAPRRV